MSIHILIVEDELLAAESLRRILHRLGYEVCGIAQTGVESLAMARQSNPDLILMDIALQGEMDGIEAAGRIFHSLEIPVIYLSAYGDEATVARAKETEPLGYLVKPYSEEELRIAIELAFSRNQRDRALSRHKQWLTTMLESIGEGIIAVDVQGRVVHMNPMAERLTGWKHSEALGEDLDVVLPLQQTDSQNPIPNPAYEAMRQKKSIHLGEGISLRRKDGKTVMISDSASPLRDDRGRCLGAVLVFQTERQEVSHVLSAADNETAASSSSSLSEREKEVLRWIGQGKCNKEIATMLHISVRTVEFHRHRIMQKLHVGNFVDLIKKGILLGLLPLEGEPASVETEKQNN